MRSTWVTLSQNATLSVISPFYKHSQGLISPDNPQFSSAAQLCLMLCDPVDCSTPGLPVHHQLPGFTQTHVHWVGDVIQPSPPLSSPSPPAFNRSQHQGLFQWKYMNSNENTWIYIYMLIEDSGLCMTINTVSVPTGSVLWWRAA